jgi:hypothetical protein
MFAENFNEDVKALEVDFSEVGSNLSITFLKDQNYMQ